MNKHTPGPWRLKESPHKREFSYFIDTGPELGSYFVAAVNNGTGPDEANARLIAAAPELLAALETLYEADQQGFPLATQRQVREQAEAAIAKAKA
jgi:hypothetical protein